MFGNLLVYAEPLQYRKTEREQGHYREQRRVNQTHCAQRELSVEDVAQHRIDVTKYRRQHAPRRAASEEGVAPDELVEFLQQVGNHSRIVHARVGGISGIGTR